MLIGGAIAVEPALQLLTAASNLLTIVPTGMFELPAKMFDVPVGIFDVPKAWLPQIQLVVIGAMLLVAGFFGMRMLEE
jgi:hypothetical protein